MMYFVCHAAPAIVVEWISGPAWEAAQSAELSFIQGANMDVRFAAGVAEAC